MNYVCIAHHFSTVQRYIYLKTFIAEGKDQFILHSQY